MTNYRGRSAIVNEHYICEKAWTGRLYRLPYRAVVELVADLSRCYGAAETWRWYRAAATIPDLCKSAWNPEDTSWIDAFLGTDFDWICNWLDEVLNENADHPVIFNQYIFNQHQRVPGAPKITTDICKTELYCMMHTTRLYARVPVADLEDLQNKGPSIWKRATKTTLAKYKTTDFQFNRKDDGFGLFVGLNKQDKGWCHFTAAELDDPKIIIREFDLTDCNDGRLYGAVVATDPTDKQFLGVAWVFDVAP
jgi:hypothetical protein